MQLCFDDVEQWTTTIANKKEVFETYENIAQWANNTEMEDLCAVLGGLLGNEIIKAISGKGEPANNTLHFASDTCEAITFLVHSKANPEDDENYKK